MPPVYKYTDKNGKTIYSDKPPLPDEVGSSNSSAGTPQINPALKKANTPGRIVYVPSQEEEKRNEEKLKEANKLIAEAQKRIPKIKDYMETLEYLRSTNPTAYTQALDELQKANPQAWIKVQQVLKETGVPTEKGLASIASVVSNHSAENVCDQLIAKWGRAAQNSLKLPTASTIPEPAPHVYSNSKFGTYMSTEAPAAQTASKTAAANSLIEERAVLASKGVAVSRVGGVVLNLAMGAADKQVWDGSANLKWELSLRKLMENGKITDEEYEKYHNMLGPQRYLEVVNFIEAANKR